MNNPFFWLGLSILLVAISLMALLVVAVFTLQELARAARSAEKLLDTLNREVPATLQDLRLTGKEIAVLSDEVSGGMQSARSVVEQVDQGILEAKAHAQKAQVSTRSFVAGATAALRVLVGKPRRRRSRPPTRRPPIEVTEQPAKAPSQSPTASDQATDAEQITKPIPRQAAQTTHPAQATQQTAASSATPPEQTTRPDLPQEPVLETSPEPFSETISPAISESTPGK